ncbi:MAG TPA: VanZ family protein [Thermoanaerobaculia bacterium]|nr:VanZ family protein [Thermoanaerobaculia bacterium]
MSRAAGLRAPLLLALFIVATAPFMGTLRDLLLDLFGRRFVVALAAGFGVVVAGLVAAAALSVREPRPALRLLRLGGLALALVLLGVQVVGFGTGNLQVDAVERIHFLEYGGLGLLFYRAFRRHADASVLPLSVLAVALVGIVDEVVQWWVPVRTGDVRDVALNAYAGLCGLLFGVALDPPRGFRWRLDRPAARRLCRAAALVLLAFAAFFDRAHLGYEIADPEIGRFLSFVPRQRLVEQRDERMRAWAVDPPRGLSPLGREDFFLSAAGWHVQHRNASFHRGDWLHAWKENLILERYFTPFLELRSFQPPHLPHRLPAAQRVEIAAKRPRPDPEPYESPVLRGRVVAMSRGRFWAGLGLAALALASAPELGRLPRRLKA